MFAGKPIIGLAGGIGSGKSFVAGLFAHMGCRVINSDEMVHQVYLDEAVRQTLRQWWGDAVFDSSGSVDRPAIARRFFSDVSQRDRLEKMIHPIVNHRREAIMTAAAHDDSVKAYVWDTPLLYESGLNKQCDAVVFVDAPLEIRLHRVAARGWSEQELTRRENLQISLADKQSLADYSIVNTADAEVVRGEVQAVFSRILAVAPVPPGGDKSGQIVN